jgi:hypothetical protein
VTEDELPGEVAALVRARDQQRQDFDRLRREFDVLAGKLRYPGTEFLVHLEYQVVFDSTVVAEASTLSTSEIFETLPGAQHVPYVLSAYAPTSSVPLLVCDGSIIVAPADAVTVAIQRQLQTGPTRIEARIAVYSATGGTHTIAVKVWRRLGMT